MKLKKITNQYKHHVCPRCGTVLHDEGYICHMCGESDIFFDHEEVVEVLTEKEAADRRTADSLCEMAGHLLTWAVIIGFLYWSGLLGLIWALMVAFFGHLWGDITT